MKELDIQNRNLIYMLNIGDIFETKDYRGNTIKGEIVTIDNYYKRSIYDSHTGIITWKVLSEYQEITFPDIVFSTYIGLIFENPDKYKIFKKESNV